MGTLKWPTGHIDTRFTVYHEADRRGNERDSGGGPSHLSTQLETTRRGIVSGEGACSLIPGYLKVGTSSGKNRPW